MKHKQLLKVAVTIGAISLLTACAGPNTVMDVPSPEGDVAGFWFGLWDGIIAPLAFIVSLFNDNVSLYMRSTTMADGMTSASSWVLASSSVEAVPRPDNEHSSQKAPARFALRVVFLFTQPIHEVFLYSIVYILSPYKVLKATYFARRNKQRTLKAQALSVLCLAST